MTKPPLLPTQRLDRLRASLRTHWVRSGACLWLLYPALGATIGAQQPAVAECNVGVSLLANSLFDPPVPGPFRYRWEDESAVVVGEEEALTIALPEGRHTLTFTVSEPGGRTSTDAVTLDVRDTRPPTIRVGQGVIEIDPVAAADPDLSLLAATSVQASDDCDSNPTVTANPTGPYPAGDTQVVMTATDSAGNTASATVRVRVGGGAGPAPRVTPSPSPQVPPVVSPSPGPGVLPGRSAPPNPSPTLSPSDRSTSVASLDAETTRRPAGGATSTGLPDAETAQNLVEPGPAESSARSAAASSTGATTRSPGQSARDGQTPGAISPSLRDSGSYLTWWLAGATVLAFGLLVLARRRRSSDPTLLVPPVFRAVAKSATGTQHVILPPGDIRLRYQLQLRPRADSGGHSIEITSSPQESADP